MVRLFLTWLLDTLIGGVLAAAIFAAVIGFIWSIYWVAQNLPTLAKVLAIGAGGVVGLLTAFALVTSLADIGKDFRSAFLRRRR